MVLENIVGLKVVVMKVCGIWIECMVVVNMYGVINVYMMVIGMIILCMVKEYINGLMVNDMKENMNLIKNVDMVYIII